MGCPLFSVRYPAHADHHLPWKRKKGNGHVEWFHRHLKDALRIRCTGLDWSDHLPWVMLGLHAAACKDTPISRSQAVFGSAVCLPGQLSLESELDLDDFLQKMKATLSGTEIMNRMFNAASHRIPLPCFRSCSWTPPTCWCTETTKCHCWHHTTTALCHPAVQLALLHHPDGRPGGGLHQLAQAMPLTKPGAHTAT